MIHRIHILSWLRVFKSANTAPLGHRGGQEREPRVVPSEKYAACRGSVSDGMRMIPACFARALQRCWSRIYMHFLLTFQGVMPIRKTRNQLTPLSDSRPHQRLRRCRDLLEPRSPQVQTMLVSVHLFARFSGDTGSPHLPHPQNTPLTKHISCQCGVWGGRETETCSQPMPSRAMTLNAQDHRASKRRQDDRSHPVRLTHRLVQENRLLPSTES
jgi:hypothetical protein